MEAECIICLQLFSLDLIRVLPCGHCYCSPCLVEYNQTHPTATQCCQCRRAVPAKFRQGIRLFVNLSDPTTRKDRLDQAVKAISTKVEARANVSVEQAKLLHLEADKVFKQLQDDEKSLVSLSEIHCACMVLNANMIYRRLLEIQWTL
jgi:hypothetical protein